MLYQDRLMNRTYSTTQEPITYSELKGKTIPKAEERIDLIEKTHLEGHIAAQGIVFKLYSQGFWWPCTNRGSYRFL
jgi:hypothetical protein